MNDFGERIATMEQRLNTVEAGVANFKQFQIEARDFFSRAAERERITQKQGSRLNLLIAAVGLIVVPLLIALVIKR